MNMILKISLVITVLIVGRRSTTVSGDGEAEFAADGDNFMHETDNIDEFIKFILKKKTCILCEDPTFSKFVDGVKFKIWKTSEKNNYLTYLETTLYNESILKGLWQEDVPLKVIIHGWLIKSDLSESLIFTVKKAYIDDVNEYNVITVDWSEFAKSKNYFKSAGKCKKVGIIVGYFLTNLFELNIETPKNMHVIGHSLGAHVAGMGGRTFSERTNKRIARITGLDPSKLGFEDLWLLGKFHNRLNSDDAEFVDVIYTSKGLIGMSTGIGHANFYPNNGKSPQPGCRSFLNPNKTLKCSHSRAYEYYSESVSQVGSFPSVECSSVDNFNRGRCQDNKISFMGHNALPSVHGKFYLQTNKTHPFSLPLPKWSPLHD